MKHLVRAGLLLLSVLIVVFIMPKVVALSALGAYGSLARFQVRYRDVRPVE